MRCQYPYPHFLRKNQPGPRFFWATVRLARPPRALTGPGAPFPAPAAGSPSPLHCSPRWGGPFWRDPSGPTAREETVPHRLWGSFLVGTPARISLIPKHLEAFSTIGNRPSTPPATSPSAAPSARSVGDGRVRDSFGERARVTLSEAKGLGPSSGKLLPRLKCHAPAMDPLHLAQTLG